MKRQSKYITVRELCLIYEKLQEKKTIKKKGAANKRLQHLYYLKGVHGDRYKT